MEVLNIENLTFKYPQIANNALENIDLSVQSGDFVLLCGASGSGKTTLLRLLKDEIAPFGTKEGKITIDKNHKIAIVTQDVENQIVSDTVWHNLAFALENMNLPSFEIRRKIAEITEFFDIGNLFHKKTTELSGGEKQLVNLASVMVTNPDILLLDEPTCQLDPIAASKFIDMIKKLNVEMNVTVIISEHRTDEIWHFANRVVILDKGKIIYSGNGRVIDGIVKNDLINFPYSVQLYEKLGVGGECPTTIRECINYLSNNYKCNINYIDEAKTNYKEAFELKDLYFRYTKNGPDILKKLNLKGNFGEILTILGGNGTGKTTLFSILSKINKPYSGKFNVFGKKIAILPQYVKAVFTKDVLKEDLALITENYEEISKELNISHILDRNPYDLSGGEAQRAALAKLLLLEPDIICLDEPTNGVDAEGKRSIQKILKELKARGVCIIIVTHDADFAAEVSDRCAFIFDGQIVSEGTPREVFSTNRFYTTYASRISRHMYKNAVTIDDIIDLCKRNGRY